MSASFEQISEQNEAFGEGAFIAGTGVSDFDADGIVEIVTGPFTLPIGPFHDLQIFEARDDGAFANIIDQVFIGRKPLVRDATNVLVGDFNGDGFDDLAVANNADGPDDVDALALSDGRGGLIEFTFEFRQGDGPTVDIAAGDFDGDGRADLFFAKLGAGSSHFISIDDRDRIESDSFAIGDGVNEFGAVTAADLDDDGDDELIAGINNGVDPTGRNIFVSATDGALAATVLPIWRSLTGRTDTGAGVAVLDVEVFDANDDGRLDILFVGAAAQSITGFDFQLLTQRANGSFRDSTADFFSADDFSAAVSDGNFAPGVEIADLDADGDLDLYLLVDFPQGDRIFFREGDRFVLGEQEFDIEGVGAAVADIDGDFAAEIVTFSQFNIRVFDNGLEGLPVTSEGVAIDGEIFAGTPDGDTVLGGGANDSLAGGAGGDRLGGAGGRDVLSGGAGADTLAGGGGMDSLTGGGGRDALSGGGGADQLAGGGGRDDLSGGAGRDELDGGGGRDNLSGGGGRDVIVGGRGRDVLEGGGGRDVFQFARGDGRDVLTDWRDGQDRMSFDGADELGDLSIAQADAATLIRYRNVAVRVEDTDADDFSAADFLF